MTPRQRPSNGVVYLPRDWKFTALDLTRLVRALPDHPVVVVTDVDMKAGTFRFRRMFESVL